jgi:uncharacterized protein YsxB (DUF464 family)
MKNIIKIGTDEIVVEGHDFTGEEKDFDAVCAAIEFELAKAIAENSTLIVDEIAQPMADYLCRNTLASLGWDKPDVPFVSVSARVKA